MRAGEQLVARCSYCGRETELHEAGVATCPACDDRLRTAGLSKGFSVHGELNQELAEATAELDFVNVAYNQVMDDIPSRLPHSDGVQRIHSILQEMLVARERFDRAYSRLVGFLDTGTIPPDLSRK